MTRFAELGFPSRRSESWRYLDLQPLEQNAAVAGPPGGAVPDTPRCASAARRARPVGRGLPSRARRWPLRRRAVRALPAALPGVWFGAMAAGNAPSAPTSREAAAGGSIGRGGAAVSRRSTPPFSPTAMSSTLDARRRARRADRDRSSGVGSERGLVSYPQPARFSATAAAPASIETYAGDRAATGATTCVAARLAEGAVLHRTVAGRGGAGGAAFRRMLDATLGGSCASCAGFALLLGGRTRAARGRRAPRGRGRPRASSTAPSCVGRQRRGEYRHHGRSRRARRARPANWSRASRPVAATARFRAASSCARARRRPMRSQQSRNLIIGRRAVDRHQARARNLRRRRQMQPRRDGRRSRRGGAVLSARPRHPDRGGAPHADRGVCLREAVERDRGSAPCASICCGRLGRRLGKLEE